MQNSIIIKPHALVSREVTEKDLDRINMDKMMMQAACHMAIGYHSNGGLAVAHAQITDNDPLRFFVYRDGTVVINPKVNTHTNCLKAVEEGCLSFPTKQFTFIPRYYKASVSFQTITPEGVMSEIFTHNIKGLEAQIWQHEIDHMDGKYIYCDCDTSRPMTEGEAELAKGLDEHFKQKNI